MRSEITITLVSLAISIALVATAELGGAKKCGPKYFAAAILVSFTGICVGMVALLLNYFLEWSTPSIGLATVLSLPILIIIAKISEG